MTYLERAKDLYAQMDAGNVMEAFETYYHPDVVVVEASGQERHGKAAQRKAIQEWLDSVEAMHGGATEFVTSNEDEAVTMVQSFTDVTIRGQRMPFREIAVQRWEGDQIIHEAFFYYVPAEMQRETQAAAAKAT
jgi:ketosteroid isomerase-like protein